ncbi:hypothetical protein ACRAWD_20185 [Caulobacter segnis]
MKGYFANDTALGAPVRGPPGGRDPRRRPDRRRRSRRRRGAPASTSRAARPWWARAVSGDGTTAAQNRLASAQAALNAAQAIRAQALASRDAAIGTREVNTVLIAGRLGRREPGSEGRPGASGCRPPGALARTGWSADRRPGRPQVGAGRPAGRTSARRDARWSRPARPMSTPTSGKCSWTRWSPASR